MGNNYIHKIYDEGIGTISLSKLHNSFNTCELGKKAYITINQLRDTVRTRGFTIIETPRKQTLETEFKINKHRNPVYRQNLCYSL